MLSMTFSLNPSLKTPAQHYYKNDFQQRHFVGRGNTVSDGAISIAFGKEAASTTSSTKAAGKIQPPLEMIVFSYIGG